MPHSIFQQPLRRRRTTEVLRMPSVPAAEDASRPRTAGSMVSLSQRIRHRQHASSPYDHSKVLSMVDLTKTSYRHFTPSHGLNENSPGQQRPSTASGLVHLDGGYHNGLALNPPTPFVYERISQSLEHSNHMQPFPSPEIGVALGSPTEIMSQEQLQHPKSSRHQNVRSPFNRWQSISGAVKGEQTSIEDGQSLAEDEETTRTNKIKRWKSVSGFLGRIRSSTVSSRTPSLKPEDDFTPPVPSVTVATHNSSKSTAFAHNQTKSFSLEASASRRSLHLKRKVKNIPAPMPPKDGKSNKRQYPALVIPHDMPLASGPISAMSPQIEVEIPSADFGHYNTMFTDALQQRQKLQLLQQRQSSALGLLERRQQKTTTTADLKITNPAVVVKNRESTVRQQQQAPSFTFPAAKVASTHTRPTRSSSLLHCQTHHVVAAPFGFKYDRISTSSHQPLFIAQEDEEYEYNEEDFESVSEEEEQQVEEIERVNQDSEESPKIADESWGARIAEDAEEEEDTTPKAPSRAPPPPPPPAISTPESPSVSSFTDNGRSRPSSFAQSQPWSSPAFVFPPSPASTTTFSDRCSFSESPNLSSHDLPPSPHLSPWDPSTAGSPRFLTYSPSHNQHSQLYSAGLEAPPLSAVSNTSKFGYDAPHSPLLAIARTVSVVLKGKERGSVVHSSHEDLPQHAEGGEKQRPEFLTRSRSERLVAIRGKASTPTLVSVGDFRLSQHAPPSWQ